MYNSTTGIYKKARCNNRTTTTAGYLLADGYNKWEYSQRGILTVVALNTFRGVWMPIWLVGGLERRKCGRGVVIIVWMTMARALHNENDSISLMLKRKRGCLLRSDRPLLWQSHNDLIGGCSLLMHVVLGAKAVDVEQANAKVDALWQAAGGWTDDSLSLGSECSRENYSRTWRH